MKRRELTIFFLCFFAAYALNVIGIIRHHSPARELLTQLHVVMLVALILYAGVVLLRVLYYLVARFWNRK
jgi:hypothetical protein